MNWFSGEKDFDGSFSFLLGELWTSGFQTLLRREPRQSRTLAHYILIDSVIFVRGLWTTKQGLKGNWPSRWRVTDTLSWRSLILLLSLHEAYITNYNAYRVIHHLMDLLLLSCSLFLLFFPWETLWILEYRYWVLSIRMDDHSDRTKLWRCI